MGISHLVPVFLKYLRTADCHGQHAHGDGYNYLR